MFGNPKRAFWQAFFLALAIFIIGILIGISFESSRLDQINEYYTLSEISLMDSLALNKISDLKNISCTELVNYDFEFADKIYDEALLLEKYEQSGKITNSINAAHKRYDLLRTILWINVMKTRERCQQNFSSIVYLYNYNTNDLTERAQQIVWSRILFDLKQKSGEKIVLIPISVNNEITSLKSLIDGFKINRYPSVIINEKNILYNLTSVEDIEKYLK
ncbi:MAG: hypothetical protein AABY15_07810 [Nanoarchaeota archaeon]